MREKDDLGILLQKFDDGRNSGTDTIIIGDDSSLMRNIKINTDKNLLTIDLEVSDDFFIVVTPFSEIGGGKTAAYLYLISKTDYLLRISP